MSRQRTEEAPAIDVLDDDLLACILDKVDCLRTIARCEAVCRRWRHVCSLVGTVHIEVRRYKRPTLVEAIWRMLAFRSFRIRRLEFTPESLPSDLPCLGSWIKLISPTLEVLKLCMVSQHSLPLNCRFPRLTHLELTFSERGCYGAPRTWPLKWTTWNLVVCKVAFPMDLGWLQELVNCSRLLEELEVTLGYGTKENSSLRIRVPRLTKLAVTTTCFVNREVSSALYVDAPMLTRLFMDCSRKLRFVLTGLPGAQLDELVIKTSVQIRGVSKVNRLVFDEEKRWQTQSIGAALESFHGIAIGKIKLNFPLVTCCNTEYGFDADDNKVQCARLHVNPSFDGDSSASLLTTFDVLGDFADRIKPKQLQQQQQQHRVNRVAFIVDVPNKVTFQAVLGIRSFYSMLPHSFDCMYVFSDGEFTPDFIDMQRKKLLKFRCVQGVSSSIVRRTLKAEALPATIKHSRTYQRQRKAAAAAAAAGTG